MSEFINEHKWSEALKHKDWYLRLADDYKQLEKQAEEGPDDVSDKIKEELYQFFESKLTSGEVALGNSGPDWDKEREPIDTIVIHHTSNEPGMTLQRLNAIHLIRLYAAYYANPADEEQDIKGTAICSNHFSNDSQVFYAYHWLLRNDGSAERLLDDNQIGWHAGDWDTNCKSEALCIDDDLKHSSPSKSVIKATAQLIRENYPNVKSENIIGHREVNKETSCPGDKFLTGWKQKVIQAI